MELQHGELQVQAANGEDTSTSGDTGGGWGTTTTGAWPGQTSPGRWQV
jgi:hypothetical protein